MTERSILLIIGGGISAYKSLELIRRARDRGIRVRTIVTEAGSKLVTPVALAALSGETVHTDLFDTSDPSHIGHIQLSRESDLVVVAPATADLMAKMAAGLAGDLASTALLATDKKILLAPAMNVRMWQHPATQRNVRTLIGDGVAFVGPNGGDLACGETGAGRMAEPAEILAAIEALIPVTGPLSGLKALVTAGPTHEAIDPVRFIANRSSGKQGYAIAAALAALGAETTLVSGPVALAAPAGVTRVMVETAEEMLAACRAQTADIVVCAAAVADWRPVAAAGQKLKKTGADPAPVTLTANPDILQTLSAAGSSRPKLVVGFAAETDNVLANATAKRTRKGCDWILANDVGAGSDVFGGDANQVVLITAAGAEPWPKVQKTEVGARLAARIADAFKKEAE